MQIKLVVVGKGWRVSAVILQSLRESIKEAFYVTCEHPAWTQHLNAYCIPNISGTETLAEMIEKMIGHRPNMFFLICWKYVSPIATLVQLFHFIEDYLRLICDITEVAPACCFNKPNDQTSPGGGGGGGGGKGEQSELETQSKLFPPQQSHRNPLTCSRAS